MVSIKVGQFLDFYNGFAFHNILGFSHGICINLLCSIPVK
jgi:hypothetical protein